MMQNFFVPFLLLAVPAAAVSSQEDSTITKVVKLLQEMLDKSKEDGTNDRTVYAKFKCYCDTTTKKKSDAIAETTSAIEAAEAQLEDLRAQNTKLSQEVAKLESDMAANKAGREEATAIRDKEKADFEKEEQDLITGIDQLERAYNLLAAVGGDQTVSGDTDSAQLMAGAASERAGYPGEAGFMTKSSKVTKRGLQTLDEDMKAALRAASVFLTGKQRSVLHSFLQAPGNYNSQSGEIVGVIKSMKDTFEANLESTRQAEEKKQKEYDEMMEVKTKEYDEMEELFEAKKKEIGDNAAQISTISSEVETMEAELAADQEFLATLTERCSAKAKEFQKRNMLRSGEEAAIAEAIAILNSDAAFDSFGKVDATSSGATGLIQASASFIQMSETPEIRKKASAELILASRKVHSVRVARIAMAISDGNPFKKVLEMINKTITIIETEEADDVEKKDTCIKEQEENEKNKADKEKDIQTLEANIDALKVAIEGTKESITLATEDLGLNRDSQKSTTGTRTDAHAVFTETLSNCEDAEKILAKAIEVLTKYYEFLHSHNAEKTYEEKAGKDSGGGNLERLEGLSVEELEKACSEKPECMGFNSAGWLKASLAEPSEWYDWDGGSLYVKMLNGVPATESPTKLLQMFSKQPLEGEPTEEFSSGQGESGNKAIDMLVFIAGETKAEKEQAITDEQASQMAYESEMQALTASETTLLENIDTYKLDLANQEKQLEETVEDLTTTEAEHAAIVKYLAEIEPGCEFIKANYETRSQNRDAEISALKEAVSLLQGTPAYQAAEAKAARAAQGECGPTCAELGDDHAKCQACLEGVTVFGYCSGEGNGGAPGCAEATATGSAAALE
jgi:septal ring factor EnvC (AmiA/AmiB activator)